MAKIGLSQRVVSVDEYDERRDCLDQRWAVLVGELGHTPVPLPNSVEKPHEYLETLDLDGVVLTGGNDLAEVADGAVVAPERDRFETATLEFCSTRDLPVLGVCRGMQFCVTHLGGAIRPVADHVAREHRVEIDSGSVPDGLTTEMGKLPDTVTVNSYHDYAVDGTDLPSPLRPIATAPDETVEWCRHESHNWMFLMWHPERDSPTASLDRAVLEHLFGGI